MLVWTRKNVLYYNFALQESVRLLLHTGKDMMDAPFLAAVLMRFWAFDRFSTLFGPTANWTNAILKTYEISKKLTHYSNIDIHLYIKIMILFWIASTLTSVDMDHGEGGHGFRQYIGEGLYSIGYSAARLQRFICQPPSLRDKFSTLVCKTLPLTSKTVCIR